MELDSFSLFAANSVILAVFAAAFFAAWNGERHAVYWWSWSVSNVFIALSLVTFMFERHLPNILVVTVPNVLLVVGFGLRWRAAREFSDLVTSPLAVYGPAVVFALLCALPWFHGSYGTVYTIVNIVLTLQTLAVAYEFWRNKQDELKARCGLVFTYVIMAASFAARIIQGLAYGDQMALHLPDDLLLTVHLVVAMYFCTASGAFALSIAYEKGAVALRHAALIDPLTGLHNRRAFEQRLRDYSNIANGEEFAIVQFDIDHFKLVNDAHGHAAGDQALRACAGLFELNLRPCDFIARIGGEEFAVILPATTSAQAYDITDRIRQAVKALQLTSGQNRFGLTVSAGICHCASGRKDFDDLMHAADTCLYQAKNRGRDRIEQLAA